MKRETVLLYGAQTSLGTAYAKVHPACVYQINGGSGPENMKLGTMAAASLGLRKAVYVDGINHLSAIGTTPVSDAEILNRNAFMPYHFVNTLVEMGAGPMRLVFVSSQTHRVPQRCTSLYCASKAALSHLVRVMARELAPSGWIINALAPGKIEDTRMSQLTDQQVNQLRCWTQAQADAYALKNVPAGRFTNCEEVCNAIDWLLDAPEYINGTTIDMMGGV